MAEAPRGAAHGLTRESVVRQLVAIGVPKDKAERAAAQALDEKATQPKRTVQVRTVTRGGRRPDLGNRYFRSSWEANYARYLNWLLTMKGGELLRWEYEAETFQFPVKRGCRFYTADFKLTYRDQSVWYVEIKGHMDQRSATKLKRMRKYHPQVRIQVIDGPAYRELAQRFRAIIAHWEGGKS